MARLAEAIAQHATRKGPVCSVAAVIPKLSKADRADLDAALADIGIAATVIMRGLEAVGHKVSETSLRRHRKGDCGCPR